jgi:hypothetical protein
VSHAGVAAMAGEKAKGVAVRYLSTAAARRQCVGDATAMTIAVVVGEVVLRQRRARGEVEGLVMVLTRSDGSQALTEDVSRVHGTDVDEAQSPREGRSTLAIRGSAGLCAVSSCHCFLLPDAGSRRCRVLRERLVDGISIVECP